MTHRRSTPQDVRAIRLVFFLQPIIFGAWFPRIAQIQEALSLSHQELSLALMGMPVSIFITLQIGGRLADYVGPKRLLRSTLFVFLFCMPFIGLACGLWTLFLALFVIGISFSLVELAMNLIASATEQAGDVLIMSSCHGFWSFGVLLGGGAGVACAYFLITPFWSFVFIASALLLPAYIVTNQLAQVHDLRKPKVKEDSRPNQRPGWPLYRVCFFALGIALTEGAMADWTTVFLSSIHSATQGQEGLGYLAFALSITLTRFCGDWVRKHIDTLYAMGMMLVIALAGLVLLIYSSQFIEAIFGIILVGMGVALGFPWCVSIVATKPGRGSSANVGLLSQMTLVGFLLSPPIVGFVAEHYDLRFGLAAAIPALLLSLCLVRGLK